MSLCMSLSQRSVCDCNKRILYCIVYSDVAYDANKNTITTKFGDRAFSVAGPWNSIPAAVREADTVSSFKHKLKTHFFLYALTMFDFDFCNALPVWARVGSGTIYIFIHLER